MSAHSSEDWVRLMYKYAAQLDQEVRSGELLPERLGRSLSTQWAVVKAIELIGEEAWKLHKAGYDLGDTIRLDEIAGMRHHLVHHYDGIDWNIIEDVVSRDIPELVADLEEAMLQRGIERPDL